MDERKIKMERKRESEIEGRRHTDSETGREVL